MNSGDIHIVPLRFETWEPHREPSGRDAWIHQLVTKHQELCFCVLDAGELQTAGVALNFCGHKLWVHLEQTRCEHCLKIVGDCAVPDFGVAGPKYKEIIDSAEPFTCPHCHEVVRRRLILWRAPDSEE